MPWLRRWGQPWGAWVCAVWVAFWTAAAGAGPATSKVIIGYEATEEGRSYLPALEETANYLTARIPDCRFELKAVEAGQWTELIPKGAIAFAFVDPARYVQLEHGQQIERLATAQTAHRGKDYASLGGTVFCLKKRNDLAGLADLMNGSLATVKGEPMGGWLAVLREFNSRHFDPKASCRKILLTDRDEEVVDKVLQGEADAGTVRAGVLERLAEAKGLRVDEFRILYFKGAQSRHESAGFPYLVSTPLYPEWAFAACPRTPRDLAQQIAAALLDMPKTSVAGSTPRRLWSIPDSYVSVHDTLKDLRRPPYENYGHIDLIQVIRQYMYWFIGAGALFVLLLLVLSYVSRLNRELVAEIESRKKAEGSLKESVERFQHVVSCSMDWIWEADSEGRFTYSSAIVKDMLGYESGALLGKQFYDLFASSEKERYSATPNVLSARMDRLFREKLRLRTQEGRVVIHEISAAPVMNGKGQVIGYRGVNRDVTTQVRYVKL